MTFDELAQRRLVFTVGKGGVGRTTVTLALALELARRGLRVLLVELEGAHGLEHALAAQRESPRPPHGVERIDHVVVDGRRALEEYLGLIIPVRRLLRTIFASNVYQYFVAAAPGLKELMTIGKIWYEVRRDDQDGQEGARHAGDDGRVAPDIVVVDGPATGHSLQYLRMPRAAAEAFPVGLVHREALRVAGLLADDSATAVVIVTTAAEMPANETAEIYSGLGELGLPRSVLVVNQVHRAPASAEEISALRATLAEQAGAATSSAAEELLASTLQRAADELSWAEINRTQLERLAESVPLTTARLPFLFAEEFGAEHVAALARVLGSELDRAGGRSGEVAARRRRAGRGGT